MSKIAQSAVDHQFAANRKGRFIDLLENLADSLRKGLLSGNITCVRGDDHGFFAQFLPSSFVAASKLAGFVPVTAIRAPPFKKCLAVSRPIPLAPPVMSARLPFDLFN